MLKLLHKGEVVFGHHHLGVHFTVDRVVPPLLPAELLLNVKAVVLLDVAQLLVRVGHSQGVTRVPKLRVALLLLVVVLKATHLILELGHAGVKILQHD